MDHNQELIELNKQIFHLDEYEIIQVLNQEEDRENQNWLSWLDNPVPVAEYAWLTKKYPQYETIIKEADGYCPFQATGLMHGYYFYFRVRSGTTLQIYALGDDKIPEQKVLYRVGRSKGGEFIETLISMSEEIPWDKLPKND